ncbi:MAG: ABC-ATPase domain-containing protein [Verrucomicrobiota bacterium]
MTQNDLETQLLRLDGKPYPAYKDLRGRYDFGQYTLAIDHVQGDPFAAPSRLSIHIDHHNSGLPDSLFSNPARRTGTENYLLHAFHAACAKTKEKLGSGKSGLLAIDRPGQQLLQRTAVEILSSKTIVRFSAGLPANGRRIQGRSAATLLTELIPALTQRTLFYSNLIPDKIQSFADAAEDAHHAREQLATKNLVAFIANDAILPRASGIDDKPMAHAIPFQSPESFQVTLDLPHAGPVTGMGIPEGITLIVGGGYHGKSTLLNALERGIYNHRPDDGRQLVITRPDAVKVRAEDGRSVTGTDLSPFINNLPGGKSTSSFTTENASGSTSQAANIIEALESGSRLLLLDEDISATNFLIRDHRMQQLIAPDKEPITPFVQRITEIYEKHRISTILVLGGSGDYFEPAHHIIAMDNYLPLDLTQQAKAITQQNPLGEAANPNLKSEIINLKSNHRIPNPDSISPFKDAPAYRGSKPRGGDRGYRGRAGRDASPRRPQESRPPRKNIKAHDTRSLTFGTAEIDLSLVSQILDPSQVRTLGAALAYAKEHNLLNQPIPDLAQELCHIISEKGLSHLGTNDLAQIRPHDLCATLNRLRTLKLQ